MRATKNFPLALQTIVKNIPFDTKKKNPLPVPVPVETPIKTPECLRCGSTTHQTLRCVAKYDVYGYEIGKPI